MPDFRARPATAGSSDAPHHTVVSAGFSEAVLQRAGSCWSLLPFVVPVTGLTVLGGACTLLAESLAVPPAVLGAVAELRALLPEQRRRPARGFLTSPSARVWTPLPWPGAGGAEQRRATPLAGRHRAAALWDPDAREVTVEVPLSPAPLRARSAPRSPGRRRPYGVSACTSMNNDGTSSSVAERLHRGQRQVRCRSKGARLRTLPWPRPR
ncbi:hypothetical protein QJS66_19035 [Kocuria rhizophila]|nr:hypothetical protein QJS66_19035 [Kocuria rhizophila]